MTARDKRSLREVSEENDEKCLSMTSDDHFLFCSLAVLIPRVGHTMDILSPYICCPLLVRLTLSRGILFTS